MVVVQTDRVLFAKAVTAYGEAFLQLNLDDATWFSPDTNIRKHEETPKESHWINILALVYHDMVTAIELPQNRFKTLKKSGNKSGGVVEFRENLQVIYIPRVIRVGDSPESRPKYDGPPIPATPHHVSGHRRKGNLTEKHRQELMDFERSHGVSILKFLPGGFTFVRPHFVPSDANLEKLPIFIKKRIQTKLQEELQRPVNLKLS